MTGADVVRRTPLAPDLFEREQLRAPRMTSTGLCRSVRGICHVAVDTINNPDRGSGPDDAWVWWRVPSVPSQPRSHSAKARGYPVAVGVQLDFKGSTLDQYDQAIERLGLLPGGPSAPAELFHWVTATDAGFRVIDVWESREAFEEFLQTKILMVSSEVGVIAPPEIQYFDVHNYFSGARWRG